jgi:hypothetical protein
MVASPQNFVRSSLVVESVVIGLDPSPAEAVAVDGSVKDVAATERRLRAQGTSSDATNEDDHTKEGEDPC